jgi:hypothetical protein
MLTDENLDHLIVHGTRDETDFRRIVASHRDALDVIDGMLRALGRNAAAITDPVSVADVVYRELLDLRRRVNAPAPRKCNRCGSARVEQVSAKTWCCRSCGKRMRIRISMCLSTSESAERHR